MSFKNREENQISITWLALVHIWGQLQACWVFFLTHRGFVGTQEVPVADENMRLRYWVVSAFPKVCDQNQQSERGHCPKTSQQHSSWLKEKRKRKEDQEVSISARLSSQMWLRRWEVTCVDEMLPSNGGVHQCGVCNIGYNVTLYSLRCLFLFGRV